MHSFTEPRSERMPVSTPEKSSRVRSLTWWFRLLLTVTCMSLCAIQSWILLRLHWSEPVAVSIGFTPWEDVEAPGITFCPLPYQWRQHNLFSNTNVTIAETIWKGNGVSIGDLLGGCEPGCGTNDTVGYPGGYASSRVGAWRTWIALEIGAVCHTLMPNVTWGDLVDMSSDKKTQLLLHLSTGKLKVQGLRVYIHSRRRPVVTSFGIRGLQRDTSFEKPGENLVQLEVKSTVIDRESLSRARCNSEVGYHFQTCSVRCSHSHWANENNCSTPDMMEDFPDLELCSKAMLLEMERTHALSKLASKCDCLLPCREHRFTASISNTKDVSADNVHDPYSEFVFSPAAIPEMVATERLTYRLPSLLSELGGFISLMLGVSVLTLLEVFAGVLKKAEGELLGKVEGEKLPREDGDLRMSCQDQRMKSSQGGGKLAPKMVDSGVQRMAFTVSSASEKKRVMK